MADNTLKKDPEMKKKMLNWMNRQPNCKLTDVRDGLPELANYVNQSVAQTYNRHLPNAECVWKCGGTAGASHFKAALSETKRGAAVDLQAIVDGEESDDGSVMGTLNTAGV